MQCLIFAHRGEAQEFIQKLSLKAEDQSFYTSKDLCLLITGEGPYEVMTKLPYYIAKYEIKGLINYGIAGSLWNKYNIENIYPVRTVYAHNNIPLFNSFTLKNTEETPVDCITTFQRVLDDKYAKELRNFSDLVDRELWAIAKVAKQFNIKLQAYKLVSDLAGSTTNCFDLKERAKFFSSLMFIHFGGLIKEEIRPSKKEPSDEFPFKVSFTQRKQIESLVTKLNSTIDVEIKKLKENHYNAHDFIDALKNQLNPKRKQIYNSLKTYTKQLNSIGARVDFDKDLEKESYKITLDINSQANIENLKKALTDLNFSRFEEIINGNFDV